MKKYLFVTHQLSLTGAPLVLMNVMRFLHERGDYISVISLSEGPLLSELENMAIPVRVQREILRNYKEFINEASEYDCVFCNTLLTFEAVIVLNNTDIPVVWWIHEHDEYFKLYESVLPDPKGLKSNIHILSVSPNVTDSYRKRYGYEPELLFFGVDDEAKERGGTAEALSGRRVKFITVGLYCAAKGQDVLAKAITLLPKDIGSCAEFYFCGDLDEFDEAYLSPVRILEKNTDFVHILKPMKHEDMVREIGSADYLVAPSRFEPMPTVACEAMMMGVPVILSDICGVAKVMDGTEGYIFESVNPKALANTIEEAVNLRRAVDTDEGEDGYLRMCDAARNLYEKEFSEHQQRRRFNQH